MKKFASCSALAAVLLTAALGAGGPLLAQESKRSVWDGVYTAAQAQRGEALYAQRCGVCHGADLGGTGEAPALGGPVFVSNWSGLSVGELFDRIRTTMPFDQPGSLSRAAYADVLAYLFKFNGFPAGATELDTRSEVLAGITIEAAKSSGAAATGAERPTSAALTLGKHRQGGLKCC